MNIPARNGVGSAGDAPAALSPCKQRIRALYDRLATGHEDWLERVLL